MSTDTAYRTADPEAIEAYKSFLIETMAVRAKRTALSDSMGRDLMVRRKGLSVGEYVVGFERFDSDKTGDLLADGALIVSNPNGMHGGHIVPNLRRKSGNEYQRHLSEYTTPDMKIPGLSPNAIYGTSIGMVVGRPATFLWDGVLYALWQTDTVKMGEQWEQIPLSTYHLAHEQYETDQKVSGNTGPSGGSDA